jgi:hypothetical protein
MADALQAGSFDSDNDGSMAALIELAMREEWFAARGEPLPTSGPGVKDRKILFAAVAKGVLRYLYAHRDDLITTLEINEGTGNHRHESAFDLVEKN